MMKNALFLAAAAALCCAGAASAQDFSSMGYNTAMAGIMHKQKMKAVYGSTAVDRHGPNSERKSAAPRLSFETLPASNQVSIPEASFSYAPSREVTADVRKRFIERVVANDPVGGRAVAQEMQRKDAFRAYRKITQNGDFEFRDVADSMSAYLMLGWMISHGVLNENGEEISDAAAASVRQQVRTLLAGQDFISNPRQRQELDEEIMYLFVITHAGWQDALRQGPNMLRTYADGINAAWTKNFSRDLRTLNLGDSGFSE